MTPSPGALSRPLILPGHPTTPKAAVLILHGGGQDSKGRARPWDTPSLRMLPFVHALTTALSGSDTIVGRMRYRAQGWNGETSAPPHDTMDALRILEERCGALPVVLVGHSLGGRAAMRAAGHRAVIGVVALAPWTPGGEPAEQLHGRSLVIVHGDRDRVTPAALSREYAHTARTAGARTARLVVSGGDHAMLVRARDWHAAVVASVSGMLGLTGYPAVVADAFHGDGRDAGLDVPLPSGFARSVGDPPPSPVSGNDPQASGRGGASHTAGAGGGQGTSRWGISTDGAGVDDLDGPSRDGSPGFG